jgi:hypothetical protein
MLPVNPAQGKQNQFKYDSEEVLAYNTQAQTLDPTQGIFSEAVVEDIRNMAIQSTGLSITKEYCYIPPLDDAEVATNAANKDPRGTIAIQYDPNNGPNNPFGNAVQVFCENQPQLARPFTFQTAGP